MRGGLSSQQLRRAARVGGCKAMTSVTAANAAPSVLFVCMGNICRSPLAELALRVRAEQANVSMQIDSAGTGDWHIGLPPDLRARTVARTHGHDIDHYRARQVTRDDFFAFDHIVALDHRNLADLKAMRPGGGTAHLSLLLDHVPGRGGEDVLDPYYDGTAAFAETWAEVQLGADGLIATLTTR